MVDEPSVLTKRWPITFSQAVLSALVTLAFFAFPIEHRRKSSSNNPIEHSHREIRRRRWSIWIFPSPASALRLITMSLVKQIGDWMTERRYVLPESLELAL